jgi:hypothetical protein
MIMALLKVINQLFSLQLEIHEDTWYGSLVVLLNWGVCPNECDSAIDHRCEDSGSPMSVSCVTVSNLDLLSSSETGVNPGIRS